MSRAKFFRCFGETLGNTVRRYGSDVGTDARQDTDPCSDDGGANEIDSVFDEIRSFQKNTLFAQFNRLGLLFNIRDVPSNLIHGKQADQHW